MSLIRVQRGLVVNTAGEPWRGCKFTPRAKLFIQFQMHPHSYPSSYQIPSPACLYQIEISTSSPMYHKIVDKWNTNTSDPCATSS